MKKVLLGFLSLGFVGVLTFGTSSCNSDEMNDTVQLSFPRKSSASDNVMLSYAKKCDALITSFQAREISAEDFEKAISQNSYEVLKQKGYEIENITTQSRNQTNDTLQGTNNIRKASGMTDDNGGNLEGEFNLDNDPYVIVTKSKIEENLEEIARSHSWEYYILACQAVYSGTIFWSCEDINNSNMTEEEKLIMMDFKAYLFHRSAEISKNVDGIENVEGEADAHFRAPKSLNGYQSRIYRLEQRYYQEDLRVCDSRYLRNMRLTAAGVGATIISGPACLLTGFIGFVGSSLDYMDCYNTAKTNANRELEKAGIPKSYWF